MGTVRGGWWLAVCTAALVAGVSFSPPSEANVYKWKDAEGRIHYTDRPPPAGGTLIAIEPTWYTGGRSAANPGAGNAAARPAAPPARGPEEPRPPEAQQARLRDAVQNDVENVRTEQCKQAKERYETYIRSRRLFKEGEKGERVYLNDAEIEEARVNAKREMDEVCAGAG
jgi:hypothetical protein